MVADRCGEAVRQVLRDRFPAAVLIPAAKDASIPLLRAMGMARARGRMIAILEDHCNVQPRWLLAVERAHREGRQAIGGAVANGSERRLVDWAVFFCEYARFMPPIPRGEVREITGNNSVYDRAVLERLGAEGQQEVWEAFIHEGMRRQGVPFYSEPDLLVSHKKEFGFLYCLSQRYHYSRSFAGMRLAATSPMRRAAYALATVALPPVLYVRTARIVLGKRRHVAELVKATPVMAVFFLVWAWGEAVGALRGPGDSLARVE